MYINSANPSGRPEGLLDKIHPLSINSCGHYKLKGNDRLPVIRPRGRIDYQLIYIVSGAARFTFHPNSTEQLIPAGHLVIFKPRDYQHYSFSGSDQSEVYWIHFSGYDIKHILKQYGFQSSNKTCHVGFCPECIELFRKIISELQIQNKDYETVIASMAHTLFIYFSRSISSPIYKHSETNLEFEKINDYFHKHYQEKISIEEFARENGISVSTLNRITKNHTGFTPLQLLLQIRLDNAKELLVLTDYPINQISELLGYDNQLYFSRLFHKHIGISPMDYRKLSK